MKKIFIYYSLTGNGDEVANYLKNKKYTIRKINIEKELPNNFILKLLTGGFKALINYKEKLIDFDNDISKYNEVIIGSPIWNSRLATPISTALTKLNLDNKKVTFILYSGSGEAKAATKYINNKYNDAKIIYLKQPKNNTQELNKID